MNPEQPAFPQDEATGRLLRSVEAQGVKATARALGVSIDAVYLRIRQSGAGVLERRIAQRHQRAIALRDRIREVGIDVAATEIGITRDAAYSRLSTAGVYLGRARGPRTKRATTCA